MGPAALCGIGRVLGGAAVVADEPVAQAASAGDAQNLVADTVDAEVGEGLEAAAAAAQLSPGLEWLP